MVDDASMIYLGRSRLHRSRANLIQTMHTVAAFEAEGCATRLYLPPWPRSIDLAGRLRAMGIDRPLDVRASPLLHPRWRFAPFVRRHRRMLRQAPVVYTRVPDISAALTRTGIVHHLEVHQVDDIVNTRRGRVILDGHRAGIVGLLIAISRNAASILTDRGADAERMHVAPSGVDLDAYADVPPLDTTRLANPHIVHIGRLAADRGLAVYRRLADEPGVTMTIVGGGAVDGLNAEQQDLVPLHEVPGWYGRSDIVLLPYQPTIATAATMSPIKMFEAMASGRPIIASDLSTLREVLEHERNALLVEADDLDGWAAALRRLREDPQLAARLAGEAKRDAAKHTWRQRARGILDAAGQLVPIGPTRDRPVTLKHDARSTVERFATDRGTFVGKTYHLPSAKALPYRLLRQSPAQRELRNARRLARVGVRVPRPMRLVGDTLVMPHIAGPSLHEFIETRDDPRKRLAVARAIGRQIARMLHAGYVNRDHKARNLLLDAACLEHDAEPVLIDPMGLRRATARRIARMFARLVETARKAGPISDDELDAVVESLAADLAPEAREAWRNRIDAALQRMTGDRL